MEQRFDVKPADVFVSFTGADRQIKNSIIEYLESKGIVCLESDKECCGNYMEWSIEAPGHCSLFLPIITKNVKETSIIKNEYDSIRQHEDCFNRIIPICTDMETYQKYSFGMHEYCSAVFDENLDVISLDTLNELYLKIKKLLIHISCRKKFNPSSSSKFFVGRRNELREINESFKKTNNLFLCGIGGIGKTELAKKYIEYRHTIQEGTFFNFIYLKYNNNCSSESVSGLRMLIDNVVKEIPIADKRDVFNNPQTIVVLDNFDTDNDEYLEEFLSFRCQKIITTRNYAFSYYENAEIISIGELTEIEQRELFEKHYGYKVDYDDQYLEYILKTIAGLTVFIPITAKQCRVSKMDLEDMCKELQKGGIPAFETSEEFQLYKDEILLKGNTLKLSRIIFAIADLKESQKKVLRNLSLLQFMYINAARYKEMSSSDDLSDLNLLVDKNWVIECKSGKSSKDSLFELHPIINELVREDLKPSIKNCSEIFKYIKTRMKIEEPSNFTKRYIADITNSRKMSIKLLFVYNLDLTIYENLKFVLETMKPDITVNPNNFFCKELSHIIRKIFNKYGYNRNTFELLKLIVIEGYARGVRGTSRYIKEFKKVSCEHVGIEMQEFKKFCFDAIEQLSFPTIKFLFRLDEYSQLYGCEWDNVIEQKQTAWEKQRVQKRVELQKVHDKISQIIPEKDSCNEEKILQKWDDVLQNAPVEDAIDYLLNVLLKNIALDDGYKYNILDCFLRNMIAGKCFEEKHIPLVVQLLEIYFEYMHYFFSDEGVYAVAALCANDKNKIINYISLKNKQSLMLCEVEIGYDLREIGNIFNEFKNIARLSKDLFLLVDVSETVVKTMYQIVAKLEDCKKSSSGDFEFLLVCYDIVAKLTSDIYSITHDDKIAEIHNECVKKSNVILNLPDLKS